MIVSFFVVAASWGCPASAQPRDNSDPDPSVEPFLGGTPVTPPEGVFPKPPAVDANVIRRQLRAYEVGKIWHLELYRFVDRLADELKRRIGQGQSIETIIATGYADGLPNSGLHFDPSEVPLKCTHRAVPPVSDQELASLRGCIVLAQLATELPGVSSLVQWEEKSFDEPDGGRSGDDYRKVEIEVFLVSGDER